MLALRRLLACSTISTISSEGQKLSRSVHPSENNWATTAACGLPLVLACSQTFVSVSRHRGQTSYFYLHSFVKHVFTVTGFFIPHLMVPENRPSASTVHQVPVVGGGAGRLNLRRMSKKLFRNSQFTHLSEIWIMLSYITQISKLASESLGELLSACNRVCLHRLEDHEESGDTSNICRSERCDASCLIWVAGL